MGARAACVPFLGSGNFADAWDSVVKAEAVDMAPRDGWLRPGPRPRIGDAPTDLEGPRPGPPPPPWPVGPWLGPWEWG